MTEEILLALSRQAELFRSVTVQSNQERLAANNRSQSLYLDCYMG